MAAQDYFNSVYVEARDLGCNHIQATLCATQSSLETGWGKHVKGNSFFGIKAGKSWTGKVIEYTTHEVVNGKRVKKIEPFRAYNHKSDSIKDYAETMSKKWPDSWTAGDIEEAARGLLTGVFGAYATDPTYADGVWKTGRKRGPIAKATYDGKPVPSPETDVERTKASRNGKPQQASEITQKILHNNRNLIPKKHREDGTKILAVRGYFRDSKGKSGANDRGIYDDALFVSSKRGVWAFNANVDPSIYRKRVASYKPDQAISFKQGIHGHSKAKHLRYKALEQVSSANIHRDQIGKDFGDFSMNIHRGSSRGGTSSLGCITVPYGKQWNEFFQRVCEEMNVDGQKLVWLTLLEYQGGKPPLPADISSTNTQQSDGSKARKRASDRPNKTVDGQSFSYEDLKKLDEMAFRAMLDIDQVRQNTERNLYYDGYACGTIEFATKIRKFVRTVAPEFDTQLNKLPDDL